MTLGPADNILCCTVMGGRSLREFCEAAAPLGFEVISSELAAMPAQDAAARLAFASVQRLRSEAAALKQI